MDTFLIMELSINGPVLSQHFSFSLSFSLPWFFVKSQPFSDSHSLPSFSSSFCPSCFLWYTAEQGIGTETIDAGERKKTL